DLGLMAAAELRDELTCCICTEIYKDPVTLICGHSFCRLCITRTWDNQEERDYSCPECRHRFRVRPELKRALSLSNIAETFRSTDAENQEQEEVRIPCTYCESPVPANKTCLMCEASLCEKHLRKHSTSAEHNIGHIEELCNLMDPVTFLEGRESHSAEYCDAEEGYNEAEKHGTKVHDVGDLDVGMILATLHSGVAGIVSKAKRSSVQETSDMLLDVNKTSDILLDLITADNHVSVSGDLRTVSWSVINQRRLETPERFQDYPQVLSSKSFSSGRHYWEVEGSKSGWWGVGMAYPSIERTGGQSMTGDNNKSWGLEKWDNNKYYVKHDKNIIRLYHSPSSRRLGIFLDYEAGRLSFYELRDPVRHLHTFTASFTEPLHAVFGIYRDNTWVRIGGFTGNPLEIIGSNPI
uniref:Uncharacterized protein n=1 Tax=Leptobrachium leishanense TaxID=445787 RepID=A0A8C5MW57_9ANUR